VRCQCVERGIGSEVSSNQPGSGVVQSGEIHCAELNMVEEGSNIRSGGVQLKHNTNELCFECVEER